MMFIKQKLVWFAVLILKNIKTHKNRKRFAKIFGNFFEGTIAKTAYDFPMIVNWYDNANRIVFEGSYGVVADFIKKLPEDSLFIDIGANQGGTSILASKIIGEFKNNKSHILAFEPSKISYKLLIKNININKCNNISAFNYAISKYQSELFIDNTDNENSGSSFISNKGEKVLGRQIKIDDLNNFNGNKNIYLKIDTEGFEMKVLEATKELFEAKLVQKLVIEIDEINLKKFGNTSVEIYDFLDKNGFQPTMGLRPGHYDEVFIKKN